MLVDRKLFLKTFMKYRKVYSSYLLKKITLILVLMERMVIKNWILISMVMMMKRSTIVSRISILKSCRMWWLVDINAIFTPKFGQLTHLMHGKNYKKLDNSLSIVELHASKPKLLVNYLSKFLLQVVKKDREFYPPTKFSSYSYIYFILLVF